MKNLTIAALIGFGIVASSTAIAATDQSPAEQAQQKTPVHAPAAAKKLVLPLDHGPHAETTHWANEQRRLHAESEVKAASADSDKSSLHASSK
jgi:hypothetical protein